ncbi:hypothetical protein G6F50_003234 [Rhizopus delemar]|uniref:Uncharacterized protein n=1 Tax=Rhizopus delemar TaxID=936053 RepID=A0A9P6Z967_9FUNG|nr:hypothetical protein G6F54_002871 [Rhizopus delemar]KAG1573006.1 hypothetical protein G6F50_003234 [Rhizopus delemar]
MRMNNKYHSKAANRVRWVCSKRQYEYVLKDYCKDCTLKGDEAKWIVNNNDVSARLAEFRQTSVRLASQKRSLSDIRMLSLDYIYFVSNDLTQSMTRYLIFETHQDVMKDLQATFFLHLPPIIANGMQWCQQAEDLLACSPSWRDLKMWCVDLLSKACKSDNEVDLIADILYNITPKLLKCAEDSKLEDTFAHSFVDPIIEAVFGSADIFQRHWANGALLGQKRKCRIEYKPDWVVYIKSWTSRLDLAVLELKRPSGSNNGPVSDFVKLGRQMKTMLGKLVDIGVESPVVCGILVEGFKCSTYIMDLKYEATYRMIRLASFNLVLLEKKGPKGTTAGLYLRFLSETLGIMVKHDQTEGFYQVMDNAPV